MNPGIQRFAIPENAGEVRSLSVRSFKDDSAPVPKVKLDQNRFAATLTMGRAESRTRLLEVEYFVAFFL